MQPKNFWLEWQWSVVWRNQPRTTRLQDITKLQDGWARGSHSAEYIYRLRAGEADPPAHAVVSAFCDYCILSIAAFLLVTFFNWWFNLNLVRTLRCAIFRFCSTVDCCFFMVTFLLMIQSGFGGELCTNVYCKFAVLSIATLLPVAFLLMIQSEFGGALHNDVFAILKYSWLLMVC